MIWCDMMQYKSSCDFDIIMIIYFQHYFNRATVGCTFEASFITAGAIKLGAVSCSDGKLRWMEGRPQEAGRQVELKLEFREFRMSSTSWRLQGDSIIAQWFKELIERSWKKEILMFKIRQMKGNHACFFADLGKCNADSRKWIWWNDYQWL